MVGRRRSLDDLRKYQYSSDEDSDGTRRGDFPEGDEFGTPEEGRRENKPIRRQNKGSIIGVLEVTGKPSECRDSQSASPNELNLRDASSSSSSDEHTSGRLKTAVSGSVRAAYGYGSLLDEFRRPLGNGRCGAGDLAKKSGEEEMAGSGGDSGMNIGVVLNVEEKELANYFLRKERGKNIKRYEKGKRLSDVCGNVSKSRGDEDERDDETQPLTHVNSQMWNIILTQEKERQRSRLTRTGDFFRLRSVRGVRLTIFSEEFLRQVEHFKGHHDVNKMLHSTAGMLMQWGVFAIMVAMLGLTPVIKENALWDWKLEKKVQNFVPQTPYIMHFGMSVIIANIGAYLWYGSIGLKDCWDVRSIVHVSRVSALYAIGESMEMFTLLLVDGTTWKVVNQLKLPMTALLNYMLLKRQQTLTQWSLIASVSIAVLGYCLALKGSHSSSSSEIGVFGIGVAIANVTIVTVAGVVADFTYKEIQYPFVILVAQGRLSACSCTVLVMILYQLYKGKFEFFFHGWTSNTVILTFWLLLKDWSVTFVLKNLDSMWKAIGTAMGLCVTYVVSNVILRWNLNVTVMILVVSVVINIVSYTFTKHEENQKAAEWRVLQKQIQDQQVLLNKPVTSSLSTSVNSK